jgi:hypothetical protein
MLGKGWHTSLQEPSDPLAFASFQTDRLPAHIISIVPELLQTAALAMLFCCHSQGKCCVCLCSVDEEQTLSTQDRQPRSRKLADTRTAKLQINHSYTCACSKLTQMDKIDASSTKYNTHPYLVLE